MKQFGTSQSRCAAIAALFVAVATVAWSCKTSNTRQRDRDSSSSSTGDVGDVDKQPHSVPPGDGGTTAGDGASTNLDVAGADVNERGRTNGELWKPKAGDFVLEDEQTGSKWNLRGEAYAGPLKGATLKRVRAYNAFWFAWSNFWNGSLIWRAEAENVRNEGGELDTSDIAMGCSGKDCIPALDYAARPYAGRSRPKKAEMVKPGGPGTDYLDARELVAGVVVEGQPRAYPLNVYSHHEIHNDRVDEHEFTLSFCPLTGTAIPFDGTHEGKPIRFGVSGRLLEANLVMFDPGTDTFWSQMIGEGVKGPRSGQRLTRLPVVETTWERWKEMYPKTLVTSSNTGYGRDYDNYLYGDYRSAHDDTTSWSSSYDERYRAKKRVLGLPARPKREAKVFPFPELEKLPGDRNVIHSKFDGEPIVVAWESEHRMAIPFWRRIEVDGTEHELTFVGKVAE